jgi:uncharacterized protein YndB with AHSA1/START domain
MWKLKFEKHFKASPQKVFEVMLSPEKYPAWAEAFYPGSCYVGHMKEGNTIHFVSIDAETGKENGMMVRVETYAPFRQVSFKNIGLVHEGEEIFEDQSGWLGAMEEYFFEADEQGGTLLRVHTDTIEAYKEDFENTWPKALDKLVEVVEEN